MPAAGNVSAASRREPLRIARDALAVATGRVAPGDARRIPPGEALPGGGRRPRATVGRGVIVDGSPRGTGRMPW